MRSVSLMSLRGLQAKGPGIWRALVDSRALRISMQAERDFHEGRDGRGEVALNWLLRWAGYDLEDPFVRPVLAARERALAYRHGYDAEARA